MTGRVLVTGGAGFIGSHLVRSLVQAGHKVLNVDAYTYAAVPEALLNTEKSHSYTAKRLAIESKDALRALILDFKPEAVFHLAAETHVDRSITEPDAFLTTNVLGTVSVLEGSLAHYERLQEADAHRFRLIHVSTDEVYGSSAGDPFTVDSKYDPRSPYSASKAASDHLARAWYHTYGLPTIVTNCSNNYGPWQFPEKLIPRMITRALTGKSMPVYGDGLHERDWLHVDDHVDGLISAMNRGTPGQTYLFGSGTATPNLQLVNWLAEALDEELGSPPGTHAELIEHVEDRPGHDRRYVVDPSRTTSELGWKARTELRSGIEQTVRWYGRNRAWWTSILDMRYDTSRLGMR